MRLFLLFFFGLLIPVISFAERERYGGFPGQCPEGTKWVIRPSNQPWLSGGTCEKETVRPTWYFAFAKPFIDAWKVKPETPTSRPTQQNLKGGSYAALQQKNTDPCIPTPKIEKNPRAQKDCALPASCADNNGVIECRDPKDKKDLDECLEIDSSFL